MYMGIQISQNNTVTVWLVRPVLSLHYYIHMIIVFHLSVMQPWTLTEYISPIHYFIWLT